MQATPPIIPIDTVDYHEIPLTSLITVWFPEEEAIPTYHGNLTGLQWARREALRLQPMYPRIRILWSSGQVALFNGGGL